MREGAGGESTASFLRCCRKPKKDLNNSAKGPEKAVGKVGPLCNRSGNRTGQNHPQTSAVIRAVCRLMNPSSQPRSARDARETSASESRASGFPGKAGKVAQQRDGGGGRPRHRHGERCHKKRKLTDGDGGVIEVSLV